MKLTIKRLGVEYVLKTCVACGDDTYARRKENRCSICGGGLTRRTPENKDKNWDELKPEASKKALSDFYQKAGMTGTTLSRAMEADQRARIREKR